jgi:hypothetical protein
LGILFPKPDEERGVDDMSPDRDHERFMEEPQDEYTDLATVESQRNDLAPEEFPDGPYGSDIVSRTAADSSPRRKEQRSPNPFSYENRELHAGMTRDYPGAYIARDSLDDDLWDEDE